MQKNSAALAAFFASTMNSFSRRKQPAHARHERLAAGEEGFLHNVEAHAEASGVTTAGGTCGVCMKPS
jgi:hypothetical protein